MTRGLCGRVSEHGEILEDALWGGVCAGQSRVMGKTQIYEGTNQVQRIVMARSLP
ncbi:hypothetical protein GCM10009579_87270 [Streptomyces javensis]|uniref:Acyl-CoA dehydrogenase/oxidase C-terminal domain-containing protein n=1 Tax=Streptomyces javensis TaxID=114698 RepID=A0ABP4I289_9ACTN